MSGKQASSICESLVEMVNTVDKYLMQSNITVAFYYPVFQVVEQEFTGALEEQMNIYQAGKKLDDLPYGPDWVTKKEIILFYEDQNMKLASKNLTEEENSNFDNYIKSKFS